MGELDRRDGEGDELVDAGALMCNGDCEPEKRDGGDVERDKNENMSDVVRRLGGDWKDWRDWKGGGVGGEEREFLPLPITPKASLPRCVLTPRRLMPPRLPTEMGSVEFFLLLLGMLAERIGS